LPCFSIIGRVAFTGKHKWVFQNMDVAPGGMLDNQDMFEKVVAHFTMNYRKFSSM
jgi:hypothetical protein